MKPLYHAIPYSAEETVAHILENYSEYKNYYLATEDLAIYEFFVSKFGERLYTTEQDRFDPSEVNCYLAEFTKKEEIDVRKKSIDYLKVLYSLSSCESIVGIQCGSLSVAALINGGAYKRFEILSKGVYEAE